VVAAAGEPLVEDRPQPFHDLELEALAQFAGRPRGDVERDHAEVAEARLQVTAFLVERIPAERAADLVGLAPGVDRHAAVALLRARVAEPGLVAIRQELRP